MARVFVSGIVPAPAAAVWSVVRKFDGFPDWHPLVKKAVVEGAQFSQEVGALRRQDLADGSQVVERLLALNDLEGSYTYEFADPGPIPVRNYVGTIRVTPVTSTGESFVEWWATYDTDPDGAEGLAKMLEENVFGLGIDSLRQRFSES